MTIKERIGKNLVLFGKTISPATCAVKSPLFHYDISRAVLDESIERLNIIAPRGHAKAQALSSRVLTPHGWTTIGRLNVGDSVVGSNGKPTRVIALHPIGKMDLYRVTTRDGRSTLCNGEHLWTVQTPSNTGEKFVTRTTAELASNMSASRFDWRDRSSYVEYRHFIPTVAPVEMAEQPLPIDPYVLGVWLGDGTSSDGSVTSADPEIFTYFPEQYNIKKRKAAYLYSVLGLRKELRLAGLLKNKHIPDVYMRSSIRQREALLQGLIDTDGTVQADGHVFDFTNTNLHLVSQVAELVRSLGGTATLGENWTTCNGKSFYSERLTCKVPRGITPCRLSRKIARWKGSLKTRSAIVDIRFECHDLARCITVAAPDGLYVTDDYLLTHNSSIVALFAVLHHLFYFTKTRQKFIVLCSRTEGHSIRLLQTIKDTLEYSQPLRAIFGYHGRYNARQWKETSVELDTGDLILTRGMGQMVIGMKHLNQRPTMIILDDPEDMENTKTEAALDYNSTWVLQALMPAGDPRPGHCKRIVIGTPQHQLCIVEKLKANSLWTTLFFSAEQPDGTALWPEWMSIDRLKQIREECENAGKLSMYYREYLCQIVGADDQLFRPQDVRYYEGNLSYNRRGEAFLRVHALGGNALGEPLLLPVTVTMGVDPASSVKESACYSAIVPVATDSHDNRYVLPYFRKRVQPMDLAEEVIRMYETYKPSRTTIETTGYQEMLRDYLRRRMSIPGLEHPEKPTTEKNLRLESMQPFFRSGKVFIQPQMKELEGELFMFPKGKSRDLMDALYYAFRGVYPAHHEVSKDVRPFSSSSGNLRHYASLWNMDESLLLEEANRRAEEMLAMEESLRKGRDHQVRYDA